MFAYAIWDPEKRRLFLARDRMGIKPLYYCKTDDFFAFSSEIKPFFAAKLLKCQWEPVALDAYFSLGYVPGPLTLFKGIYKLPPGYSAAFSHKGQWSQSSYWDISPASEKGAPSFEGACRTLDRLLNETVQMHLMSEVPLGVFLSGGIDSSLVTALASRYSDQPVKTFSVGYENAPEANELHYARMVAKRFNTEHREFILKPKGFMEAIPELVRHMEEPVVELAAIPLLRLSQLAKPHATVLLSGEGADEIFGGYALYRRMLALERYGFLRPLLSLLPKGLLPTERHIKYADWLSSSLEDRYRGTSADLTLSAKGRFYSPDFLQRARFRPYMDKAFSGHFQKTAGWPDLSRLLYVDAKTWLVDDLLIKADKMTMAASVELRVPFLDHEVVDFASALPARYKVNRKAGKLILKKTAEKYLPAQIVHRSKKGFPLPVKRWMGGELLPPDQKIAAVGFRIGSGAFQSSLSAPLVTASPKRKIRRQPPDFLHHGPGLLDKRIRNLSGDAIDLKSHLFFRYFQRGVLPVTQGRLEAIGGRREQQPYTPPASCL